MVSPAAAAEWLALRRWFSLAFPRQWFKEVFVQKALWSLGQAPPFAGMSVVVTETGPSLVAMGTGMLHSSVYIQTAPGTK